MIALTQLFSHGERESPVSLHQQRYYAADQFCAAVTHWTQRLAQEPAQRFALYADDAYPFAVLLFALLHAGKQVWIPGNNRPGTALQLGGQGCELLGDWRGKFDYALDARPVRAATLPMPDARHSQIVLFTSGSTGAAKAVYKCLQQLQTELETLERYWGGQLGNSEVLSTVSHQHIYGLLFRLLWPLAAGRCFHSRIAIGPEALIETADKACWVASPAHLKRLNDDAAWHTLAGLSAIFSSGGPLPLDSAQRIATACGKAAIEIYGSTETGGIGWRRFPETEWTLFAGMRLCAETEGVRLHSPYLHEPGGRLLEDAIDLKPDGRFGLHGRRDRIAKIEEKRLSLDELEQRVVATGLVAEAAAWVLAKNRDTVAIAASLSAEGWALLQAEGRKALIRRIKDQLATWFEAVVLPRRWLFLQHMPRCAHGKIDNGLLRQLLPADDPTLPLLQCVSQNDDSAELQLKVPAALVYFPDHFPAYPLLPGVVQLAWVQHFAALLLPVNGEFSAMEAVKFVKPIQPDCELSLKLQWLPESHKLYFSFDTAEQNYSSGRLIFAGVPQ